MTPFPETEIMTLKRLEVAIRKMEFKLLKDGAYKLHEKYHSGHKFEYIDLLKEIYSNVTTNPAIPSDIKDILVPTIEDILNQAKIREQEENLLDNRISSLTSLSYNAKDSQSTTALKSKEEDAAQTFSNTNTQTTPNTPTNPIRPSAYDFFGGVREAQPKPSLIEQNTSNQTNIETQTKMQLETEAQEAEEISKPFKEFSSFTPISAEVKEEEIKPSLETEQNIEEKPQERIEQRIEERVEQPQIQMSQPPLTSILNAKQETPEVQRSFSEPETRIEPVIEKKVEIQQKPKMISIFFGQDSSKEKVRNILKLRELISKAKDEQVSLDTTLRLMAEIKTQTNTNVSELRSVLEQLKTTNHKVNLISDSSSSNLVYLLREIASPFSYLQRNPNINLNLVPIFGLSNMFSCTECSEKYLHKNKDDIEPLILSCPRCKSPMYPTLYAFDGGNTQIDIDYYNYTLASLAESDVWLLIHPGINGGFTLNLLKTAMKISKSVKEVYIIDKDINVRETYKSAFTEIKENEPLKVDTQINALENFLNSTVV